MRRYFEYFCDFSIENLAGRGETVLPPHVGHLSSDKLYFLHSMHRKMDLVIVYSSSISWLLP